MWHFCPTQDGVPVLGNEDGRPVKVGETLSVDGPPVLCEHGLHASEQLLDALGYAVEKSALCLVDLSGEVVADDNKACGTERSCRAALSVAQTESLLRAAARHFARGVLHLWDAPPVVHQYLETGDALLQAAAWDAAGSAARAAAWDAARAAARDAARDAAGSAAFAAARAAAWDAARDAAWAAAWAASRAAAWAASRAAAWDAARDAARDAAWDAAWAAAWAEMNTWIEQEALSMMQRGNNVAGTAE